LTNLENRIKECETGISDHRVRIENANALISRYKEQQNNVRNNREYDNLSKEIEYQELDIESSQKKISRLTAELEDRQADKAKTITDIEDRTVDLNQKRNELESILSETKEQTEKLMLRAADLEKNIEDRLVTAFHRIRKNAHNGLAVVKVERDSCGGCHSKIPAQRQLDIRLRKKIIVCELCGRILVDTEIDAKKK
jgi:predicted  nucleic acid-binding Zn-ribbon protein